MKKAKQYLIIALIMLLLLPIFSACKRDPSLFAKTPKDALQNVANAILKGDIDEYYRYLGTDTENGTRYLLLQGWLENSSDEDIQEYFEDLNEDLSGNGYGSPVKFMLPSIWLDEFSGTYEEYIGKPAPQIHSLEDYIAYQKESYPVIANKTFESIRVECNEENCYLEALSNVENEHGSTYEEAYSEVLTYLGNIGSDLLGSEITEIWETNCYFIAKYKETANFDLDFLNRYAEQPFDYSEEVGLCRCKFWYIVKFEEGYLCIPAIFIC